MLARIGDDALKAANLLGCDNIYTLLTLTQKDWEEISKSDSVGECSCHWHT
jgi:hypothetical protein